MNTARQFIDRIKWLVNAATAAPGLEPGRIAEVVLTSLARPRTTEQEKKQFAEFMDERRICHLVHFTRIENLRSILRYGLIPRRYLEDEPVRIVLRPAFADSQRNDGITEANCISISFPNYRMFYKKRGPEDDGWAVLLIDPIALTEHRCGFAPRNLASNGVEAGEDIHAARRLFSNVHVRKLNGLPREYTTDPQAEVLEYSVVPQTWIREVHLRVADQLSRVRSWVRSGSTRVKVDESYFQPRQDWRYWTNGGSFAPLDDYGEVVRFEGGQSHGD